MKILQTLAALGLLAGAALAFTGQDQRNHGQAKKAEVAQTGDAAIIAAQLPTYPLTTCLVSGEELAADSTFTFVVDGKMARTCCEMCAGKVKKDAATFIAKIDAAVIAQEKESYPLTTCAVSGEELGSMGDAIDVVTGTRLVRVCCKGCTKKAPAMLA